MKHIDRRNWLRSAAGLTGALAFNPLFASAPVSEAERTAERIITSSMVKLNANENPFGLSPRALRAVQECLTEGNRYPFGEVNAFREVLARHEGVAPEHIHLGAGSGHLLCQSGIAFGIQGGSIVSANPTFPILMNYAEAIGTKWKKIDLNDRLEHPYEEMASAVSDDTRLVFVCNPNNPTGTLVDPSYVRSFCETISKKTTVYSDEAYVDFLPPHQQMSMTELVKKDMNVIVSRTFSKVYGLAGLRLGYLVGRPDLIKKVTKVGGTMEISRTAVVAAAEALKDQEFVQQSREKNKRSREILTNFLDSKKIFYGKSETNFVFFPAPEQGRKVLEKLQQKGYLIRIYEHKASEWCRVSVGTEVEMQGFVSAYASLYS